MSVARWEDELAARLARAITAGDILTDGRLPSERELSTRFDVSRARLRIALDALEAGGLIYRRQGKGTFAAPPTVTSGGRLDRLAREVTPQDIMEVRLEIEPALAALAASRATDEELDRLRQLTDATRDLKDRAAYERADEAFHYRIAVASRNPLFLQVYDSIRTVRKLASWGMVREESHSPEVMTRFGDQHARLFDTIAARDMAGAAGEMERHLMDVHRVVTRGVHRIGALARDGG
ncbi:FadR/GntR family transcriptional regulator [Jannaschia rubra]|uniref:L-lactate utilization operon repressor n=1 Tax=Jannaschia rubra TaxID=282197 RepID=A0A0M6XP65_9RHOB|nr:FCD domain-containing protein [Jannaschia rubra]CTQ31991.1 L-lactate utilization operon repressor [Jannaschia rubra]SFG40445.1 transcriptional regulator, GntR family [Jannaschia rubra]